MNDTTKIVRLIAHAEGKAAEGGRAASYYARLAEGHRARLAAATR